MSESRVNALAVLAEVASWDQLEGAASTDLSWPEVGNLRVRHVGE